MSGAAHEPGREPLRMEFGEKVLMGIFLFMAVGAAVVATTFQLPEARDFPLGVAIITAAIIGSYFVIMAVPALSERMRPYLEDDIFVKINAAADALDQEDVEEAVEVTHPADSTPEQVTLRRERTLVAYTLGLGVLAWIIGLTIAVPVFMVAMMMGYSKESPRTALISAATMSIFLLVLFNLVLRQPLHFGLLGELF